MIAGLTSAAATSTAYRMAQAALLACLPEGVDGTRLSLGNKLVVLNCLVFSTPHDFWVRGDRPSREAEQLRSEIDDSNGRFAWLKRGDWSCTKAPDGPVPSCLKHDVAYGSLQSGCADRGGCTVDCANCFICTILCAVVSKY